MICSKQCCKPAVPTVSLTNLAPKLTGIHRPAEGFKLLTTDKSLDAETVLDLLYGKGLGLLVKRYIDDNACHKIADNASQLMQDVRTDEVPAIKLGADHFGKSLDQYFAEVESTSAKLNSLFSGTTQVAEKLRFDIQQCLDQGMAVRRAQHNGRLAGDIRAARWTGSGGFSLGVHDDQAQLTYPAQVDFEIQQVRTPVAFNIYPVAEANSGRLRVYNLIADRNTKQRLNITHTGYPYPTDLLADVPFIDVPIEPGDLVVLNGRFLHGVTSGNGKRLLLNLFAGLLNDQATVVTYT